MSEGNRGGCQEWVRGPWWLPVVGEGIKVELSVAKGPQLMKRACPPHRAKKESCGEAQTSSNLQFTQLGIIFWVESR